MPKTKGSRGVQVKIPATIAAKHRLHHGDMLGVHDLDACIVFIQKRVKSNKKLRKKLNELLWNFMEQEAEDDIKAGRVAGPFGTVEELLRDLKT